MPIKRNNKNALLARRVSEILDKIELTRPGLAAFLNIEDNTLYSVKAGRYGLPAKKLAKLAAAYSLPMKQFLDPDFELPDRLIVSEDMKNFMEDRKLSGGYFKTTIAKERASLTIKRLIEHSNFFDNPVTSTQILAECNSGGTEFSIHAISSAMSYLRNRNRIHAERHPIIRKKDGKPSSTGRWYYWKKKE